MTWKTAPRRECLDCAATLTEAAPDIWVDAYGDPICGATSAPHVPDIPHHTTVEHRRPPRHPHGRD